MISVATASRLILKAVAVKPSVDVSLSQAHGRILRKNIQADRDYPSFNKALMDGIAISFKQWEKGQRSFIVENTIPAGVKAYNLKNIRHCVHIMTGAVVPKHLDCIIPIENIVLKKDNAVILGGVVKKYQFIRLKGADVKQGVVVLQKGVRLSAAQIGLAASMGSAKISVNEKIRVAIISTGDELVDVQKPIQYFQTRLSNAYAMQSALEQTQLADTHCFHLIDDPKVMAKAIKSLIAQYDVLVFSGGVSQGVFDFLPVVLENLGVKAFFHGVNQKPGKPLWFGKSKDGTLVFGLPGNPASTLCCVYKYVIPCLFAMAAGTYVKEEIPIQLKLASHMKVVFIPIKNGKPLSHGGSGDFNAWAQADGFIEYDTTTKKNVRPYFSWRV